MSSVYLLGFKEYSETETTHHLVVTKLLDWQSRNYDEENPRVPVPKREWQNVHRDAPSVVQDLLSEGLIDRDYYNNPSHSGGQARCYHYWITDKGFSHLRLIEVSRSQIHGNTFNSLQSKLSSPNTPTSGIAQKLSKYVESCRISPTRLADLLKDPNYTPNGHETQAVSMLNNAPFTIRSSTERRVHTSFSLLPSSIKSLVSLQGHSKLVEADISASNPFLLAHRLSHYRLNQQTPAISIPPPTQASSPQPSTQPTATSTRYRILSSLPTNMVTEYYGYSILSSIPYPPHYMCNGNSEFLSGCLDGSIYDKIADAVRGMYKKKTPSREDGKGFMMLLMNEKTSELQKYDFYTYLRNRWPEEINLIEEIKGLHDQRLGVSLMREEATMVIDTITRDLLKYDIPFLTAHDGIYVPKSHGNAVKKKMEDHYERVYGTTPRITIE